jgi:dTDP-glucose 4,6-dehydratase
VRLLVTGGAGFIGSEFVRQTLAAYPTDEVTVLDKLTYAGNLENLRSVTSDSRFRFVHGDIGDRGAVETALEGCLAVVNFAAETHVDRSIRDPATFLRTDTLGTLVLLEAARTLAIPRYLQVSTDEIYGHVAEGESVESDPARPRSPYAASKAGGDLLTLAYHSTYGVPVLITRGSNTYGPNQYPEKIVPLFVTNLIDDRPVPLYGDGLQIRDWLYVEDHARAILHVLERGETGAVYNIAGGTRLTNLELTRLLTKLCGRSMETHVRHVADRPGHDRRYALDASRLHALGWGPAVTFDDGIARTIDWYRENPDWWRPLKAASSP